MSKVFKKKKACLHFLMMSEIAFLSDFQHVSSSHHFMSALKIVQCPQVPKQIPGPLKFSFLKGLTSRYISHCSDGSVSVRYYFQSCYIIVIQDINYLVINFGPVTVRHMLSYRTTLKVQFLLKASKRIRSNILTASFNIFTPLIHHYMKRSKASVM